MARERCTVTIICFNEEANLRDCLASVAWADEIVLVDSGSTDRTLEIAREFNALVLHNPWPGMREQKNFAADQATSPWVLNLDADERITPEGRAEIERTLENPAHDAYHFPRKNFFLGRWMRHGGWYPDHVLRLYRRDRAAFAGVNPHTNVLLTSGTEGKLREPITHFTYTSFAHYISKQYPYVDAAAREITQRKGPKRVGGLRIFIKTCWKFIEVYILKRGFLDGVHGLIAAFGSTFAAYMRQSRLWELGRSMDKSQEVEKR